MTIQRLKYYSQPLLANPATRIPVQITSHLHSSLFCCPSNMPSLIVTTGCLTRAMLSSFGLTAQLLWNRLASNLLDPCLRLRIHQHSQPSSADPSVLQAPTGTVQCLPFQRFIDKVCSAATKMLPQHSQREGERETEEERKTERERERESERAREREGRRLLAIGTASRRRMPAATRGSPTGTATARAAPNIARG